jgi:hypothetical protein
MANHRKRGFKSNLKQLFSLEWQTKGKEALNQI